MLNYYIVSGAGGRLWNILYRMLEECAEKSQLIVEVGKKVGWPKLWDSVMDLGPRHVRGARQSKSYNCLNTLSQSNCFFSLSSLVWISAQELSRLYHAEHMLLFREISLASNHLTTLHDVTHLCRVQTLDLDDNQLEMLPEDMAKLPELRVLSLRRNSIRH